MGAPRHSVGIPEALDATGRLFGVEDITPTTRIPPYRRPLVCPGCGVAVEPVNWYLTRRGTAVGAHFRIAKNQHHSGGCRFDHAAECSHSHRNHADVLKVVGERYQLDVEALLAFPSATSEAAVSWRPPDRRLAPGPSQRGPDRGGLADIVRLIERFAFDRQAQEQFAAVFRGEQLSWRDFCFDAASEIKRFHNHLQAGAASIPRTLVGVVSAIYLSKSGGTYAADIMVRREHSPQRPVLSNLGKPILPVVRAHSLDQIRCTPGDRIAAFGLWRLFGAIEQPTLWLGQTGHVVVI